MSKSRVLAVVVLVALAATPAFAYVQTGTLAGGARGLRLPVAGPIGYGDSGGVNDGAVISSDAAWSMRTPVRAPALRPTPINRDGNRPSHPVPEPGTMAMASMGLMALGAHLKRSRGR